MRTIPQLNDILTSMGSDVTFHREEGGAACPCRSAEGFRMPAWHREHLLEPICNEQGFLATVITEYVVKASIQPPYNMFRRTNERANELLGEVQRGDMLGIFPVNWGDHFIDFEGMSEAGEDYVLYDGKRYIVVAADKVPDVDGDPNHHWELGLRLVKGSRPNDA